MSDSQLCDLTMHELSGMLRRKGVSSVEITQSVLERIEQVEGEIHSYVTVLKEQALEQAKLADKILAQEGEPHGSPLLGIPVAVKDIFCTRGVLTTCSSKILANFYPPYDATVVERLKSAGAVMVGKTNMDEFAMGSSTENSSLYRTFNPWDRERVPGGSSGGSAAAVAGGECIAAVGTDTGGSIRQPASFCGIVGLKPTYGRVSRYGMIAFASSLDQGGPLTRDVEDAALLLGVIAGYDPRDSTSVDIEVSDYTRSLKEGIKGVRVGIPREYFISGIDGEVGAAIQVAIKLIEAQGAELRDISLPHTEYALPAYYIIAPAEASSNLARYDGVRYGYQGGGCDTLMEMYLKTRSEGFGEEVKRRIMLGTYALSSGYYEAYYLKAQRVRTLIREDFARAFKSCDVMVTPTSPTAAFKMGEKIDDPLKMYLSDIFTIPCNLAGVAGISIPGGFTSEGLPIGIQFLSGAFGEEILLRVAYAYEQATDWHRKRPVIGH